MAAHVSHFRVQITDSTTFPPTESASPDGRGRPHDDWEKSFAARLRFGRCRRRWTQIENGKGFIHSFNGPHSLFIDTIRRCGLWPSPIKGHMLGAWDRKISLLQRLIEHAETASTYAIYYGEGRGAHDVRGRTAREHFQPEGRSLPLPDSQQGYSPFSTDARTGLGSAGLCRAIGIPGNDQAPRTRPALQPTT
jgi:hypothetical protein